MGILYSRHSEGRYKDRYAFGHTTQKNLHDKFVAIKYRIVGGENRETFHAVKTIEFGRRRIADKRAAKWYEERRPAWLKLLEQMKARDAPNPKPTAMQIDLDKFAKVGVARGRCLEAIDKHQAIIKGLKTRLRKLTKSLKYYDAKIHKQTNVEVKQ